MPADHKPVLAVAVTLRLTGGGLAGPSQTKLLTAGTLSIGRGSGNDWVLPDPERHLSKTHCVISIEGGRTVLTDLSTNGVHINGARQATARDSRVVLTDGDEFRLGEYTIVVTEIEDSRPAGRGAVLPDPFAVGARGGIDPFDAPAGPDEGRTPLDIDPLEDPLGRPPDPNFQHPFTHKPLGPKLEDPFDVAEERARRPVDPEDDLIPGARPSTEWQGPTQPDHADAPQHAFSGPRVLPPADPNAIDFDALIGDIGPARPAGPAPQARAPGPRDPFADLDSLLPPEPQIPVTRPVEPVLDPFNEPDRPAASRPVAPTPAPPPAAPGEAAGLLAAFLEGAGVAVPAAATSDPEAAMRLAGQVFRAMTEGLIEVLRSRAAIKGDMRLEQTMIRAHDNNALKFSISVDDAVAALLTSNRPGYMQPLAATKEAFQDLKSHELAVMAGVQTALLGLLKRFEPAALESRLAQGLLGAVVPAARKARYWDSFRQVYGDIVRESEDDFQAVFGREFAKAYKAQARKSEGGDGA